MASASASNSGLHSESASSQPLPAPKEEQDEKPTFQEPKKEGLFDRFSSLKTFLRHMENQEEKEKFERYFAEMTDYITAKYFSDKTMFGGNIYDVKVSTDGQTVKASRFPPSQSFADPATFMNLLNNVPKSEEEAVAETSNGKQSAKKN